MSLVGRYLSALPVIVERDGGRVNFSHMLPLWYYAMAVFGVTFREAVIAIREGRVHMSINKDRPVVTASAHLERDEKRTSWKAHMTNPDTVIFCRVAEWGRLESLDEISSNYLTANGKRTQGRGLLTAAQHASLPELYQDFLDNLELPVLIFSDAASWWFDAD